MIYLKSDHLGFGIVQDLVVRIRDLIAPLFEASPTRGEEGVVVYPAEGGNCTMFRDPVFYFLLFLEGRGYHSFLPALDMRKKEAPTTAVKQRFQCPVFISSFSEV